MLCKRFPTHCSTFLVQKWLPEVKSKDYTYVDLPSITPKAMLGHKHYNSDRVVFSNEKRFARRPEGPVMVWRQPSERNDPRCVRKHAKFGGGGIMVWGAELQVSFNSH